MGHKYTYTPENKAKDYTHEHHVLLHLELNQSVVFDTFEEYERAYRSFASLRVKQGRNAFRFKSNTKALTITRYR